MNIKSPDEWAADRLAHWQTLSKWTRRLIVFAAAEITALAILVGVTHAACDPRGGDIEYELRDCGVAPPSCLRGSYGSSGTFALVNGSPVSPHAVFYFHKAGIWNGHSESAARDPVGTAMLYQGYDRVPGLSAYLRAHHALDSLKMFKVTGAQLISMGIAKACR
jgi:hypothetical protein